MPGFRWDTLEQLGGARRHVCFVPFNSDATVAVGDGLLAFTVPRWMNGMFLETVLASVYEKGVTGTTDVQVRRSRAGVDTDLLSTKVTLGDEFYVEDGVVNASVNQVITGDQLYIDVDAVHSSTAPVGLSVTLSFIPKGAMG